MTSLTLRYNNPGAVEFAPWMAKYGATVGPNGRYAQFPSMDAGYGAMNQLLDTYQTKHGLNTVGGIVNRWAPPNVDNNSTGTYATTVASKLGLGVNDPIPADKRGALMHAMAGYEAGAPVPVPIGLPPSMALGGPQPKTTPAQQGTPMPTPSYAAQGQQPGFLSGLANALQQPLTQQGIGLLLAASQGGDLNAGMSAGAQRANMGTQDLLHRMELDRLNQQRQLMGGVENSPGLAGLPQEVRAAMASMDPQSKMAFLGDYMKRRSDIQMLGDVERQKAEIDMQKSLALLRGQKEYTMGLVRDIESQFSPKEVRPGGVPGNARKAGDGQWYVPDPSRPGKYLMWKE